MDGWVEKEEISRFFPQKVEIHVLSFGPHRQTSSSENYLLKKRVDSPKNVFIFAFHLYLKIPQQIGKFGRFSWQRPLWFFGSLYSKIWRCLSRNSCTLVFLERMVMLFALARAVNFRIDPRHRFLMWRMFDAYSLKRNEHIPSVFVRSLCCQRWVLFGCTITTMLKHVLRNSGTVFIL